MKNFWMSPLLAALATGNLLCQGSTANPAVKSNINPAGNHARCRASELVGCSITNSKNEALGSIEDIVLESGNSRIAYAVVTFGGFLSLGAKFHAMPWRLLEIDQRSGADQPRITLGLTPAVLKAAPGFDQSRWPDLANPAWDAKVEQYYSSLAKPAGETDTNESGNGNSKTTRPVDKTGTEGASTFRRVSQLIGMSVVDRQDRHLAEVEDLVVNLHTATIDGFLVSTGGILGMGEKLALLTADTLTLDRANNVFVFPHYLADLQGMALPNGVIPPLAQGEWMVECRRHCAKFKAAESSAEGSVRAVEASARRKDRPTVGYDLTKVETVSGTILTVGTVALGYGSEECVRLRIRTQSGREMIVHAAPSSHARQSELGLRAGKSVEVVGAPAEFGSQTVLVAGKLTVDDQSVSIRDDQGRPAWTQQSK
jgi:sporulation protein YlmC with PRC-barrel domain